MAEVRKREEERRVERKVQKEREEEGSQFADKEAFVTSAYKKKMQEQQEQEERERREAAMEGEMHSLTVLHLAKTLYTHRMTNIYIRLVLVHKTCVLSP